MSAHAVLSNINQSIVYFKFMKNTFHDLNYAWRYAVYCVCDTTFTIKWLCKMLVFSAHLDFKDFIRTLPKIPKLDFDIMKSDMIYIKNQMCFISSRNINNNMILFLINVLLISLLPFLTSNNNNTVSVLFNVMI